VGEDPRQLRERDPSDDALLFVARGLEQEGEAWVDPTSHGGDHLEDHRLVHRVDLDRLDGEVGRGVARVQRYAAHEEGALGVAVDRLIEAIDLAIDLGAGHTEDLLPDVVGVEHVAVLVDEVHASRAALHHELHELDAREAPRQRSEGGLGQRPVHDGGLGGCFAHGRAQQQGCSVPEVVWMRSSCRASLTAGS